MQTLLKSQEFPLKTEIRELNLSARELAIACDYSETYIYFILRGSVKIPDGIFEYLVGLGVDTDDLKAQVEDWKDQARGRLGVQTQAV